MLKNWNNTISLDGTWQLFTEDNCRYTALEKEFKNINELEKSGFSHIPAAVPGNFELDMEKAGILPELMTGLNILEVQKLENKHLWYCTRFNNPYSDTQQCMLRFDGIDTYSEIYLNGEKIAETDNMLIPHEVSVPMIKVGENELVVHIRPAVLEARKYKIEAGTTVNGKYNAGSLSTRKAPHMYGWDIMPRVISGGLWRSVSLICKEKEFIEDIYLYTAALRGPKAVIFGNFQINVLGDDIKEYSLEISGSCGESSFFVKYPLWHTSGRIYFYVDDAKLWWTRDMGEQNIYDVTVTLKCGEETVDTVKRNLGIRDVKIERTSVVDKDGKGEFLFLLNGQKLFVRGTNWVPLDAFHSRDKERMPKALDLLLESGCNMVRCWGGNVYEEHEFFDFCDRNGIAVWQDFAMGCAIYPRDKYLLELFEKEADSVIRNLRDHCSIFLWAGDNECDVAHLWSAVRLNPAHNKITREILPEAIRNLDPMRVCTYLPSSPYLDEEAFKMGARWTEDHIWGRCYYKEPCYMNSVGKYASEIGYFGCPAPESLRKFMTTDGIWPYQDSMEWRLAAVNCELSETAESNYVTGKICENIVSLFGKAPENLSEYTMASQITQSEAMKFFVEHFRVNKWDKTGIMCWNIIDGWPQTSNGFVDYYFKKKLVFETVRIAQLPVCLACDEPKDGVISVVGVNEHLNTVEIEFTVTDLDDGLVKASGKTVIEANIASKICQISYDGKQHCYKLCWKYDGNEYQNHYLAGEPAFDFERVVGYYEKLGLLNRKDYE